MPRRQASRFSDGDVRCAGLESRQLGPRVLNRKQAVGQWQKEPLVRAQSDWFGYGLGVLNRESVNLELGVDAHRRESPVHGGADNAVLGRATLGW